MGSSTLNLHTSGADLILSVLVQPGAKQDAILGVREGSLKIAVSAPPVEGKANAACRRLLADILRVPVSRVEIIAGAHGRRKRIRIRDTDFNALKATLAPFLE